MSFFDQKKKEKWCLTPIFFHSVWKSWPWLGSLWLWFWNHFLTVKLLTLSPEKFLDFDSEVIDLDYKMLSRLWNWSHSLTRLHRWFDMNWTASFNFTTSTLIVIYWPEVDQKKHNLNHFSGLLTSRAVIFWAGIRGLVFRLENIFWLLPQPASVIYRKTIHCDTWFNYGNSTRRSYKSQSRRTNKQKLPILINSPHSSPFASSPSLISNHTSSVKFGNHATEALPT